MNRASELLKAFAAVSEGWLEDDEPALSEPGKYLVIVWANKAWTDCGWEHDSGIILEAVTEHE